MLKARLIVPSSLLAVLTSYALPLMAASPSPATVSATAAPQAPSYSQTHTTFTPTSGWWIGVEGGYAMLSKPSNTVVGNSPNTGDAYAVDSIHNSYLVGVSVGYQFAHPAGWLGASTGNWLPAYRLALAYDYLAPARINGQRYEYLESPTTNYDYDVSSNSIWLDNQLDIYTWHHISPFVEAALGVAFNQASGYGQTPIPPYTSSGPVGLNNHEMTCLAFRVGAGVHYDWIMQRYASSVSVQYRYSNLGEAQTTAPSTYPADANSNGLNALLRSNEIVASYSFKF